ncbi:MAG: CinA family protein [Candidatus Omnitrophica bacterium]|nr:CinA family protein [Candidatus Omnitrophota bacterium]
MRRIHTILTERGRTVAVAESCTGGLISASLTAQPGSSAFFLRGIIAYSNQSKEELLGIPRSLLRKAGAVSDTVARKMAQNIREQAGADRGIGVTGIAGPSGGTKDKPVGTVYIAVSSPDKTVCKRFSFRGTRRRIRQEAARRSLVMLRNSCK